MDEKVQEVLQSLEELKGLAGKITTLEEMHKATDAIAQKAYGAIESLKAARKIGITDFDSEGESKKFLEWFMHAANDFKFVDPEKKATMVGDSAASGGYLVPEEFLPTLIRIIYKYGKFRQGATVVPMNTDTLKIPSLASELTVQWLSTQASSMNEVAPTFSEVELAVKTMACLVPVANELMMDSMIDVANLLATLMGEAVAKEEDRIGFAGDVTGNGDPYNGILNATGVNIVTLGTGRTKFADLTADDIADMIDAAEDDDNAVFVLHRTIFNVIRKLKDQNGNYIYQSPDAGEPGTIWGYPYVKSNVMPKISQSAADTSYVIFGNLRYAYLGNRQQMQIASSPHAGFTKNVTYVRMIERIAIAVGAGDAFSALKTAAQ